MAIYSPRLTLTCFFRVKIDGLSYTSCSRLRAFLLYNVSHPVSVSGLFIIQDHSIMLFCSSACTSVTPVGSGRATSRSDMQAWILVPFADDTSRMFPG